VNGGTREIIDKFPFMLSPSTRQPFVLSLCRRIRLALRTGVSKHENRFFNKQIARLKGKYDGETV
jgi:hypothetical protein